jgi:hypothetical protein
MSSNPFDRSHFSKKRRVPLLNSKKRTNKSALGSSDTVRLGSKVSDFKSKGSSLKERKERIQEELRRSANQIKDSRLDRHEESESITVQKMRLARERQLKRGKKASSTDGDDAFKRAIEISESLPRLNGYRSDDDEEDDLEDESTNRKARIEEERDNEERMTELDEKFSSLMMNLPKRSYERTEKDAYDELYSSLIEEKTVSISSRRKTDIEIAYEKQKELSKLQAAKESRELGEDEESGHVNFQAKTISLLKKPTVAADDDEDDEDSEDDSLSGEDDDDGESVDEESGIEEELSDDEDEDEEGEEMEEDDSEGDQSDESTESSHAEEETNAALDMSSDRFQESVIPEESSDESDFESFFIFLLTQKPKNLIELKETLLEKAKVDFKAVQAFYNKHFFSVGFSSRSLDIIRLSWIYLPLTDFQHRIVIPMYLRLRSWASEVTDEDLKVKIFGLLWGFLKANKKFDHELARLYKSIPSNEVVSALFKDYLSVLPSDSLKSLYPEFLSISPDSAPLYPLTLFHFKPLQVPSMEPLFGQGRKDLVSKADRERRELYSERRSMKRELGRDAEIMQSIAIDKKRKFNARLESNAKRERSMLEESNRNIQQMSTTNIKRPLKKSKQGRMAGNKTEQ